MLKQYAAQLNGVIKLIFQPAEEGTRGARAMVAAGVVDDVDYFTAIHIGTGVPAGTVVCGGDNFLWPTTKFDGAVQRRGRPRRRQARGRAQRAAGRRPGRPWPARHPAAQRRRLAGQRRGDAGRYRAQRGALFRAVKKWKPAAKARSH